MRGYPAGMMMVTKVETNKARQYGRGLDNKTEVLIDSDFQLFDGQQRLTAILLGLGAGSLASSLQLWVDIGSAKASGDRLFELRINSIGQPFGYKPDAPNEKVRAEDRHTVHTDWPPEEDGTPKPPQVIFKDFSKRTAAPLISAKCAVPLRDILSDLITLGKEKTQQQLQTIAERAAVPIRVDTKDLLIRLQSSIDAEIIVKLVSGSVLDESNYPRFFGRLGQGGTRLSDEELIYSLIKDRYPQVHDRISDIVREVGRFVSEVDLVLGALRIAQTIAPWPEAKEWERAGRPTPDRVRSLHEKGAGTTELFFESMLPENEEAPFRLLTAIEKLYDGLLYHSTSNPFGLPSMLLARLPRDLLDVLLLFTFKRGEASSWNGADRSALIAFVLYWLLFVGYDDKASYRTFVELESKNWAFGERSVASLLRHFEAEGIARCAPRPDDWQGLTEEVQQRGCKLATWAERFSSKDDPGHPSPGEALRMLSTHSESQKRLLIWMQRRYITRTFPHYNPTSTRDDDLPFDLDHAIPQSLFGFHWSNAAKRVELSTSDMDKFRDLRRVVGDSLGNLRWLAASDNRGRGMGRIEEERLDEGEQRPLDDHIDRSSWNKLIVEGGSRAWTDHDVAAFQRLIDTRTLVLVKLIMEQGGIANLIEVSAIQSEPMMTSGGVLPAESGV
jgi:hypothetical protein